MLEWNEVAEVWWFYAPLERTGISWFKNTNDSRCTAYKQRRLQTNLFSASIHLKKIFWLTLTPFFSRIWRVQSHLLLHYGSDLMMKIKTTITLFSSLRLCYCRQIISDICTLYTSKVIHLYHVPATALNMTSDISLQTLYATWQSKKWWWMSVCMPEWSPLSATELIQHL